MNTETETTVRYKIAYGRINIKERNVASFTNLDAATVYFKQKESIGMHVDAFKETITTTTITEKLSP